MGPSTASALALVSGLLGAPEPVDLGADYAIERWTIDDGLPQSSVTGIAQSQDGYLWLTTFGGVVRFDGVRFELFDRTTQPRIGGHRFVGVAEDDSGSIWLGIQDRGLTRRRGRTFESVLVPGDPQGAVSGPVKDGRGTLWATIGTTLVRVRDEVVSVSTIRDDIYEVGLILQVDDAGALWLTSRKGVACWDGPCERPHELIRPSSEWLTAVARTPTGGYWHTGWGDLEGTPIPRPIGELWAHSIWWNGRTWWSAGAELASIGPGGRLTRLDLRALPAWESNAPAMVYSYLRDREGALWVGTGGGGLYQVKSRDLTRFSRSRGLPGVSAWEVVEDRSGRIWVNSRDFLSVIEDGHGHDPDPAIAALLPLDALAVDQTGTMWLASAKLGLHRLVEGRLSPALPELGTQRVQLIGFDPVGVPWLGLEGAGLLRLLPEGRGGARWTESQLGGSPNVVAFAPGGVVWVGTSGGLVRIVHDQVERVGVDDGLTPGAVRSLLLTPGGALWVGTYGAGMARVKDGVVRQVTHADGLCENVASRIIDDGHGYLWINGNRGVSRLRLADLEALADRQQPTVQCALYDSGEGNGPGGLLASDGKLWFPTINGVVSIDPDTPRSSVVPLAKVESAELDGVLLESGGQSRPGRGDLVVHSTALSFLSPRAIQFRYRLVGLEDTWAEPSSSRVARYAKLPPGAYRFEVEARSVDGVWSEPASLAFALRPHVYETGWFAGLSLLAAIMGLWGASALRTRSIRARNRALQQEIEQRERVEAALREQEAHYRTVFERSSEGLFVYELDGRLADVNAAAQALLGKDTPTLLQEAPLSWVAPESRSEVQNLIAEVAAGKASGRGEIRLNGPAGQLIEVRMAGALLDQLARPQVLLSAVDLTPLRQAERERRELEHQLQQSQKLEALGLLAGGIAHDFNNLLTAMGGQAALVRGANPEDREHLEGIQSGVKRAAALTKKLLVFGRKSINSPKVIAVDAQLEDLVAMLERTMPEGVSLELRHLRPGLKTKVDPVRLEQMVINLVVNSRDAIGGRGRIRIASDQLSVDAAEAHRQGAKPGEYVVISVADDGAGIDEAIRERIFEPFFTTKEVGKGTGLGLSIVHGAVREAGGFVTVESERGKGATFRLHLPVAEAAPDARAVPDPAARAQATATVLVCDDEPAVQRVMARALRAAGYRVIDASGPEEAEALVLTATDPIDLLITDVVMPQMSGPELARRVRESLGEVPVLFVSGHTRDLLEERGLEGRAEFLAKPFTVAALVERVAALVARSLPPRPAGK